jgi:hypothetical protein
MTFIFYWLLFEFSEFLLPQILSTEANPKHPNANIATALTNTGDGSVNFGVN